MDQNSDFPDELPPTESRVVSKIEAALDNVLDDLDLDPDQQSIKYEKYIYLTADQYPPYDEPAISYSWFKWGISNIKGPGGDTPSERFHTSNPAARHILQSESAEIQEFIKTELDRFPIEDWWEEDDHDFLRGFYDEYADKLTPLYKANIDFIEQMEFITKNIQGQQNLISERTYLNTLDYTTTLEEEVYDNSALSDDFDILRSFTELYRDVVLTLVELGVDDIRDDQETAVDRLEEIYNDIVWPLLSHRLSETTTEGPNEPKIQEWAQKNHSSLRENYERTNIGKICDHVELLRPFKQYLKDGETIKSLDREVPPVMKTVLDHREDEPVIAEFCEDHSLKDLATVVDLTPEYVNGNLTFRGVANSAGIPKKAAFDLLEVLGPIVDEPQDPKIFRHDDMDEETRQEHLSGVDL